MGGSGLRTPSVSYVALSAVRRAVHTREEGHYDQFMEITEPRINSNNNKFIVFDHFDKNFEPSLCMVALTGYPRTWKAEKGKL